MTRLTLAWLAIWVGQPASAHVSERAIVLLLPTDYYSTFGVLAVILTVVLTIVVPPRFFRSLYGEKPARVSTDPPPKTSLLTIVHAVAFLGFAALITIGLFGPRDPLSNLLPLTIFTVWWICLLVVQATLGNIWRWINPWAGPVGWFVGDRKVAEIPTWFNAWPALAGFMLFTAYYLLDIAPDDPARLAKFAGGYWLVTFILTGIFGREWLTQCETFTVLFNLVTQISAFPNRHAQPPGRMLIHFEGANLSLAVLSVSFLAIGSFDGLNETFWWFGKLGINPLEFSGRSSVVLQNLLGLFGSVILLNLMFTACVFVGHLLTGRQGAFAPLYFRLALTLLPIGIGYHLAHYLTSVMVNLQYWYAALDDPLKSGHHFLGLDGFHVTAGFLNQYTTVTRIWLTQAGAIVVGHILAVVLAHAISLEIFEAHKTAVKSQVFLAIFMVAYTFFGLWLLASPTAL